MEIINGISYLDKNLQLSFGMYKGYKIGIVYAFDPGYISWCIEHTQLLSKYDFSDLLKYGVVNQDINWQYREAKLPECIYGIDAFNTFEDLTDNLELEKRIMHFDFWNFNSDSNVVTSSMNSEGYPKAKFIEKVQDCNPQNFTINYSKKNNNGVWLCATLNNGVTIIFESYELAVSHNDNIKKGGIRIFDVDGQIQENSTQTLRSNLKIGVNNGQLIFS